jgi:hypothetical protein
MSISRRRTIARRAGRIALGVLGVYVIFLAAMFVVMRQPPDRFGRIMAHFPMPAMLVVPFEPMWNVARGGALRVGDEAPDFTLPLVDHSSEVRLSSFRGQKPVILVFGNYT